MVKRIGVLTSGGDCPGLNAAIRSIVRTALGRRVEVLGFRRGYKGLITGEYLFLDGPSVSGIINRGGTILLTARDKDFETARGIRKAAQTLERLRVDGLIVLGGNGSLKGAAALARRTRTAVIGVPKSIDNDVGGTDFSIGFDTAVNTATGVIDKIRDTATSHERLFFVEVMGRKRGFLALATALAGGAEAVLLPETSTDIRSLCRLLDAGRHKGKVSSIVVVAEGDETGGAFEIARKVRRRTHYDVRVSVIGHQQRGGAPSAFDRILASQLGSEAVNVLLRGGRNKMVGIRNGKVLLSPLERAWKAPRPLDPKLLKLSAALSR